MENKHKIIENICYTELVYERINKKLRTSLTKQQIEKFIFDSIQETEEKSFEKTGKNYYVTNIKNNIKITINSNTFRIITVDRIDNK